MGLRIRLILFSALALVTILASCGKQPAATSTTTTVTTTTATTEPPKTATTTAAPTTPSGPYGDLKVAQSTFGNENYNVIRATRTSNAYFLSPVFDFIICGEGAEMSTGGITDKWDIATDALSWTFHIRKGVKFHDGSDVTTADIAFSLAQYESKNANYSYMRDMVDHTEIVDDQTIKIFTKGVQPFLNRYASGSPGYQGLVLPKTYYEGKGADYFLLHPIGAGAFKLVKQVPGDTVELEAFDKYYRGAPAYKRLSMILVPEDTTRIAMLKTGQINVMEASVDSASELETAGFRIVTLAGSGAKLDIYGSYDKRGAGIPVADVRVRKALSLAINRDEIGKNFFHGKMTPAMPASMWPNQPEMDIPYWKEVAAKYYRYAPDEAMALLKDAGYPNGFSVKFYAFTVGGGPYLPKLAEVVQGYWLKIGVKAEIVPTDYGVFGGMRTAGPNRSPANELVGQIAMFAADGSPVTIQGLSSPWWNQGPFNLLTGAIPEVDTLVNAALMEPSEAKRKDLTAKMVQLCIDTWTSTPIGRVSTLAATSPEVDASFPDGSLSIAMYADTFKHKK